MFASCKVQVLGLQQMDECMFFPVHHPFIKVQCEEEEKCTGVLGEGDCMFPSRNLELDLVCTQCITNCNY